MRRLISLSLIATLISTLVVTTFSDDAEARRRKRKKAKRAPIINEKKLFERIGGAKGLSEVVDEWMRLNIADPRVAPFFAGITAKPETLAKLRRNLNDQLCEMADGPCQMRAAENKQLRDGVPHSEDQFLAFADNLFRSMQKNSLPEREKNELLGRLGELRAEVVQDTSAATSDDSSSAE